MTSEARLDALKAYLNGANDSLSFKVQNKDTAFLWVGDVALNVALVARPIGTPWTILPSEFSDWKYADGTTVPLTNDELDLVLKVIVADFAARSSDVEIRKT